jgi:hypothetical protein
MKISEAQTNQTALVEIGAEAIELLRARDFPGLVNRFGYALAFGRDLSAAVEADFAASLLEFPDVAHGKTFDDSRITVKYFNPNASNLFALIECLVPVENGSVVLLELVVTSSEGEKHVCLEQISAAA